MRNRVLSHTAGSRFDSPFQTGVSLHGHTCRSMESLGFIERFLGRHRPTQAWMAAQTKRGCSRTGIRCDLAKAYWTPPLGEVDAYALETGQMEALGLRPIVSLSDHDTITACTLLRGQVGFHDAPISTEWTVPFGEAVFHIGVHNLPGDLAPALIATLHAATAAHDDAATLDLLAQLNRLPSVLLVFNHPVWNFNGMAPGRFRANLARFLELANGYLHAFELNGMRNHQENHSVLQLAGQWKQVLVAGGDRHGCEPNAAINLTDATDLAEFVEEIRDGRKSTILLMPQYSQPLNWRFYRAFTEIVAEYPEHPAGRRLWDERVFHPDLEGKLVPVIDLWHLGPPGFLKKIFATAIFGANLPFPDVLKTRSSRQTGTLLQPGNRRALEEPVSESLTPSPANAVR